MKYFCATVLLITCHFSHAQNLLPLVWQLSTSDTIIKNFDTDPLAEPRPVNLLLSWERQGYFSRTGTCRISADFVVPEQLDGQQLSLNVGLQCVVKGIYINGSYVTGNLPDLFRTNRDSVYHFILNNQLLLPGKTNRISLVVSDLCYTGGKSHNVCSLTPLSNPTPEHIKVAFSGNASVFRKEAPFICLNASARNDSWAEVFIINDVHDTLYHTRVSFAGKTKAMSLYVGHVIHEPGFYECVAVQKGEGYSGDVKWFALQPEKVKGSVQKPAKYAQYWDSALRELAAVKPGFRLIRSDYLSKGKRDAYIIEFASVGDIIVRGYYFVPRDKHKHAAVVHLPWYGQRFDQLQPFIDSKENVAELALCVRGHGISADVFNPGFDVPGVWGWQLADESKVAYRAIYLDCVRAVEFLRSRPEVDAARIGVIGVSQGGGLALATAGLMRNKIKACAYFDPFPCDIRDQLKIRTICREEWQSYLDYYHQPCTFEQAMDIQDLVDASLMATQITCRVFYTTALSDDDCPSRVGFAAYNAIRSQKQYKVYPLDSHLGESGEYGEMKKFLKGVLVY